MTHVIVASPQIDPRDEGFHFAVPGELVYVGLMCATDESAEDPGRGGCGCGRAFSGVTSHRATTLAEVVERDVSRETYLDLLATAIAEQWRTVPEEFRHLAERIADQATECLPGTILVRSGYRVGLRDIH